MFSKLTNIVFFFMCCLAVVTGIAYADGFLDKEPTVKGEKIQGVSPKYGNTVRAFLSARPNTNTKINVSSMKKLWYSATTTAGAAIPVKIWLYNQAGTQEGNYFVDPDGTSEVFTIGPDIKYVGFGHYSSTTYTDEIHVFGR